MNVNDFFDKIYCINLPERTDKWKECEDEFNKHNLIVEKYDALKGYKKNTLLAGEVGLILTNIEILKDAITNNYNKILILEDDVIFNDDFNEKFESKISDLPDDWETLHLGGNHFFDRGLGKFKSINNDINFIINGNTYRELDNDICTTAWSQTTHAVGVHSNIFNELLTSALKLERQIDNVYCEFQQSDIHKTYAFLPSICLQRPTHSDIQGRFVDYNNYTHYYF